ncbi:MAG TPA: hypothetical protein VFO85_22130, partial [Vicinamibacteria bacterium]|nr:hypothetical protein [Vicinamibacteria bacterium]
MLLATCGRGGPASVSGPENLSGPTGRVAFIRDTRDAQGAVTASRLYVRDMATGDQRLVREFAHSIGWPVWSPDGQA